MNGRHRPGPQWSVRCCGRGVGPESSTAPPT